MRRLSPPDKLRKWNGARVGDLADMRTGATPQSRLSTTRRPRFAKSESIAPSSWPAFWIRWNVSPTVIVGRQFSSGCTEGIAAGRKSRGRGNSATCDFTRRATFLQQTFPCMALENFCISDVPCAAALVRKPERRECPANRPRRLRFPGREIRLRLPALDSLLDR